MMNLQPNATSVDEPSLSTCGCTSYDPVSLPHTYCKRALGRDPNSAPHLVSPNQTSSFIPATSGDVLSSLSGQAFGTNYDYFSNHTKDAIIPPNLFSHDFRSLVKAKAAKDQRRVPTQEKQRDASIELHLERYRNSNFVFHPPFETNLHRHQGTRDEISGYHTGPIEPWVESTETLHWQSEDSVERQIPSAAESIGINPSAKDLFFEDAATSEYAYRDTDQIQFKDDIFTDCNTSFEPYDRMPTSDSGKNIPHSEVSPSGTSFSTSSAQASCSVNSGDKIIPVSISPSSLELLANYETLKPLFATKVFSSNPRHYEREKVALEMIWDSKMNPKPRKTMRSRNKAEKERICLVRKAGACEKHRRRKKRVRLWLLERLLGH